MEARAPGASVEETAWEGLAEQEMGASRLPRRGHIGVVLGESSRGLVDVDLDTSAARNLGPSVGPAHVGRPSVSLGHRLFNCDDHPGETIKWSLRRSSAERLGLQPNTDDKSVILELRASGQTMFPPSIHPAGERVEWRDGNSELEPPSIPYSELKRKCDLLAFLGNVESVPAVTGTRHASRWPAPGCLCVISGRAVDTFVRSVAAAVGDEEAERRAMLPRPRK